MVGQALTNSTAGEPTYLLAIWLFLRLLGVIYFVAFASLAAQVRGLIGGSGILPAAEYLARRNGGMLRWLRLPTLCWFNTSDRFLLVLSWGGAALSLLLIAGFAPLFILILLWLSYLSLFNVSRLFLGYQWDILLLETGFLAIFLASPQVLTAFQATSEPPAWVRWLLWWLLFRLIFSSGLAKLRSGDVTWRRLEALQYHYETQPLPTRVAWYAHQLPKVFHQMCAAIMFAIEVAGPFLILGPPVARHWAAFLFILLMVLIQLTGNYCFFNLLGIALSILLLDDQFLRPAFARWFGGSFDLGFAKMQTWSLWAGWFVAPVVLLLSLPQVYRLFRLDVNWPKPLAVFFELLEPFRLVSGYGLFSVMTTERPEIVVEGSDDGVEWKEYEFKWKPGDVKQAPRFVAPHQPRLDWQMWFAALGYFPNNPWFHRFLLRLLEGAPAVWSLLRKNPFPDAPPKFVRATIYDYRFTNRAQRAASGEWWRRERRGLYSPVLQVGSGVSAS